MIRNAGVALIEVNLKEFLMKLLGYVPRKLEATALLGIEELLLHFKNCSLKMK